MLVKGMVFSLVLQPAGDALWRSEVITNWTRVGSNRYLLKLKPSARFSDGSFVTKDELISSLQAFRFKTIERNDWIEVESLDAGVPIERLFLHAVLFKETPKGRIGTGPFQVGTQNEELIDLRRVRPITGRINNVELVATANSRDAFARALRGEINALIMPDPGQIELLKGVPRFTLVRARNVHAVAAVFNAQHLDPLERRGLADSLPVTELSLAHGGGCEVDAERQSRRAIPLGRPLSILVMESDAPIVRTALALRRALGSRGGTLELEQATLTAKRVVEGLFDILVAPIQVWPTSQATLRWRTGMPMNFARYSNPVVDAALDRGDYGQADRELVDNPPALYICRPERSAAIDARIKNPRLGPYDFLESLPEWEVAP
jgi:MarR-like DNA-binding transcriptional regulator SgrR of sgrS sRNA